MHIRKRDEKEAVKQAEKTAKDGLKKKDKLLSLMKPKVEKEKAEVASKKTEVSKTPKKKVTTKA